MRGYARLGAETSRKHQSNPTTKADPPTIDPIIDGLLKRLPKTGDVWPEADRKLWLQLLEGSFKLIYKDAAPKIPPPPGDAKYRKAQGMPPPPDDKGIMG